jgi:hypothetical protein
MNEMRARRGAHVLFPRVDGGCDGDGAVWRTRVCERGGSRPARARGKGAGARGERRREAGRD